MGMPSDRDVALREWAKLPLNHRVRVPSLARNAWLDGFVAALEWSRNGKAEQRVG
jgi:hypothetical protein